jgi:hypothetical protein
MSEQNITSNKNPSIVLGGFDRELHPSVLYSRILSAMADGENSYAIYRRLNFAVQQDVEPYFDDIALHLNWKAYRLNVGKLLLESEGLFIQADGGRKSDYCSVVFRIWADSIERAEQACEAIQVRSKKTRIMKPMVTIGWGHLNSRGSLQKAYIEEVVDDVLYDEAYPELKCGVAKFISDYLASSETILVLQGKPGTGKTRMIRAILGAMTLRNGRQVSALYTSDKKALESDEIFLDFVTGDEDAFVIEDADYILKPRTDGNDNLHRFLTIADGVVRAQGRKIIFSTNLPNLGDLDDALIRPGRCFARLIVRELSGVEAGKLLAQLSKGDASITIHIIDGLSTSEKKGYSVAEIYRAYDQAIRKD